uniref:Ribonuclease A-domain domain-containing protein n=1 Tax=Gopherus evgoodei TaxID=1825980 RepID=A0A8C4Y5W1_9SAUR
MALRGPCPLLFLNLVLLVTGLAQIISPPDSYQNFVNEHVDFPKTRPPKGQSYCDHIMQCMCQNMAACKLTHTFIHAPASRLRTICNSRGRCNLYNECDSNAAYPVTSCWLNRPPPVTEFVSLLLLAIKHFPANAEPVGVFGGLGHFRALNGANLPW